MILGRDLLYKMGINHHFKEQKPRARENSKNSDKPVFIRLDTFKCKVSLDLLLGTPIRLHVHAHSIQSTTNIFQDKTVVNHRRTV